MCYVGACAQSLQSHTAIRSWGKLSGLGSRQLSRTEKKLKFILGFGLHRSPLRRRLVFEGDRVNNLHKPRQFLSAKSYPPKPKHVTARHGIVRNNQIRWRSRTLISSWRVSCTARERSTRDIPSNLQYFDWFGQPSSKMITLAYFNGRITKRKQFIRATHFGLTVSNSNFCPHPSDRSSIFTYSACRMTGLGA